MIFHKIACKPVFLRIYSQPFSGVSLRFPPSFPLSLLNMPLGKYCAQNEKLNNKHCSVDELSISDILLYVAITDILPLH